MVLPSLNPVTTTGTCSTYISSLRTIYGRRSFLLPGLNHRSSGVVQQAVKAYRGMGTHCEEGQEASIEMMETQVPPPLPPPSLALDNGVVEANQWPRPLSPLSGEQAKGIELERALKAEAAMASVPAFSPEDIIYQDQWLIVINKPSGIYSGHILSTVTSMMSSQEGADEAADSTGATASLPHLHLANRLDRDTSGVIIVTKCKMAAGKLTHMFQNRKAKKTYVALCIGPRPVWDEVYVETGHGRSRWGAWRVYANEDVGRKLPEKAVVRDMSTQFSVLSVNGERVSRCCCNEHLCEKRVAGTGQTYENVPAFGDEVLLRAHPLTGRTHQIRLHCQFLGIPMLGDVKYGGPLVWKGITYDAHTLHAESMSFRHPVTDVELTLSAPLPKWAAF